MYRSPELVPAGWAGQYLATSLAWPVVPASQCSRGSASASAGVSAIRSVRFDNVHSTDLTGECNPALPPTHPYWFLLPHEQARSRRPCTATQSAE
jgi:hypothetical protein